MAIDVDELSPAAVAERVLAVAAPAGGADRDRVPVELGERRYEVLVGDGVRAELARVVAERVPAARRAAVVTQEGLRAAAWFADIDPGLPFEVHTVAEGEEAKSMATVERLCREFARPGLTRADVVVAVGGGMVTDVVGFAAASFHRGTPVVNVATTLLGQVDAAVGGKTGVNLPEGKNLVGAFWQPAGVLCDTAVLCHAAHPGVAVRAGGDGQVRLSWARPRPDASILELALPEQVARCVAIKAEVVAADEREGDRRMVLNYGHTLAHALEAASFGTDRRRPDARTTPASGCATARPWPSAWSMPPCWPGGSGGSTRRGWPSTARWSAASTSPATCRRGPTRPHWWPTWPVTRRPSHDLTFVLDGPRGVEAVHGVDPADALATLADMASGRGPGGVGR